MNRVRALFAAELATLHSELCTNQFIVTQLPLTVVLQVLPFSMQNGHGSFLDLKPEEHTISGHCKPSTARHTL